MVIKNKEAQGIQRIDGRLHSIDEIRSEAGELLSRVASPLRVEFKPEDIAQLIVGALMLGVPVALTEEVWNLGEVLSPQRILMIVAVSLAVNAFFVKALFYPKKTDLSEYRYQFIMRVVTAYTIALLTALLLLELIGMGLFFDPVLALKRAVIVALPASFAATVVDYIR
jgi:uncharacterized membrane protein